MPTKAPALLLLAAPVNCGGADVVAFPPPGAPPVGKGTLGGAFVSVTRPDELPVVGYGGEETGGTVMAGGRDVAVEGRGTRVVWLVAGALAGGGEGPVTVTVATPQEQDESVPLPP